MLSNSFHYKLGIGLGDKNNVALEPKCCDFIDRMLAKLDHSLKPLFVTMTDKSASNMSTFKSELFDNESPTGQELHNFLDTICYCIMDCLKSKNTISRFDFAKFLPHVSDLIFYQVYTLQFVYRITVCINCTV